MKIAPEIPEISLRATITHRTYEPGDGVVEVRKRKLTVEEKKKIAMKLFREAEREATIKKEARKKKKAEKGEKGKEKRGGRKKGGEDR